MSGDSQDRRISRLLDYRRNLSAADFAAGERALLIHLRRKEKLAQQQEESSSNKKAETTSAGGNDDDRDDEKTLKDGSGCNGPENLKCSHCETWCTSLEEMDDHIARTHTAEPFKCPYCDNFQCNYLMTMEVHLHEFHDVQLDERGLR